MGDLVREIGLDAGEIQWRKEYINFDAADAERLASLRPLFEAHADDIADSFYGNLTQYDRTVEVISRSPKAVDAPKEIQRVYFMTLSDGQYGVYYDLILPLLTERAGDQLTERLHAALDGAASDAGDQPGPAAIDAIVEEELADLRREITSVMRLINLDMQVVADTDIHSYSRKLRDESSAANNLLPKSSRTSKPDAGATDLLGRRSPVLSADSGPHR